MNIPLSTTTLSRRHLLLSAAGVVAATSTNIAITPPPSLASTTTSAHNPRLGWDLHNIIEGSASPLISDQAMNAQIKLLDTTGAGWVRLGMPLWTIGGFYGDDRTTWIPDTTAVGRIRAHLQAARHAGYRTILGIGVPHRSDASTPMFLSLNRTVITYAAAHLGDLVDAWQVLNETNLNDYRYNRPLDENAARPGYWNELDAFLAMAVSAIKATKPSAYVTTTLGGYPADQVRWTRWSSTFATSRAGLDAWSVNAYPDPDVPSQIQSQHDWAQSMKKIAGSRPLVVMETGMPTTSAERATKAMTAIPAMMTSLAAGSDLVIGYQLSDRSDVTGAEAQFGLYDTNGRPKKHTNATIKAARQM